MKKILLPILALGGLLFASSCQMDEPDAGTLTGEVDFSITAGIPSGITTYAEGAEAFSHQGGASNLSTDDYILRYTLQVYDEDDKLSYEGVQYAPDFGGVTFEARLLAKVYDFVFWADFVSASDQESDLYYNTEDLRKISYTSSVTDDNIPSDALDAYYKTEVVNLSQSGQKINNVTLKRPFGKIRFVATDELSEQQKGAVDNGKVSVAYQEGTELPNVFDAQTGKAAISEDYQTRMSDFTATPVAEKASVNGNVHENAYLLGYDYIFCSESQPSYAMDVPVSIDGVSPVTRSLSSIPVQENKLTTVIGNFYTNEGSIDVIVEDEFGNGEDVRADWDGSFEEPETDPDDENTYHITTPAELAWVAEQVNSRTEYFEGKTILLMNDIDLYGSNWTPVGNVNDYPTVTFKGTFDGQNHVISNLTASDDAAVYAAAGLFGSITGTVKNVTLKNVNIRSTHYAGAVVGYSSTNGATIENCHVDGGTITTVPEYTGSAYDNGDKAGGIIGYYVTSTSPSSRTTPTVTSLKPSPPSVPSAAAMSPTVASPTTENTPPQ